MSDTNKVQQSKDRSHNFPVYVADGSFSMSVDFDDEWEIEATCWRSKLGNNQWELTRENSCDWIIMN